MAENAPKPQFLEPLSGVQVGIIMGSDSDLPTMRAAAEALRDFGIACEVGVPPASRHRQMAAAGLR